MKRMYRIAGVLLLAVFVSLATVNVGQAAGNVTMKLAWAETADPYSHPTTAALTVFKNYVESSSGGSIDVNIYPAGQLGDAKSMLEQVKRGVIQSCASVPSGMIAGSYYQDFNIFDIPYLFSSNAVAWRVLEPKSKFFQDLANSTAKYAGIRPLGFFIEGRRHFTNNAREIRKPEDLKGLKIRTMEVPAHQQMMKAMGAIPTPVSWLELYSALQTGVVNGQENPIGNIAYLKAYEVQKYLTLDGHLTLLNTWVVNEQWFKGLTNNQREIIKEAAEVATLVNRGYAELKDTTGIKELKEKGMKIYSPTNQELAAFKAATQPTVVKYIEKSVKDPAWIKRILKEVNTVEASLKQAGQITK